MSDPAGLLEGLGLTGPWQITTPSKGVTGRTVYADAPGRRIVLKFAPAPPLHERLSELGVAAPVLACGHDGDCAFHVQQRLDGEARDWAWMAGHIDEVVALIVRYATDGELTRQLRELEPTLTLASHRRTLWEETLGWYALAREPSLTSRGVRLAVAQLEAALASAGLDEPEDITLVPSHTDVNNTNVILVADGGLVLVDWDGLVLSDPARDPGTLLWWYRPDPDFDTAWAALGLPEDSWPATTRRAHWWAAVTSLRAALWNDQRGADHGVIASFAEDVVAAAHGRPNPKQHGSTMPVLS